MQAIFPYKCTVMLGESTYINTLSPIVDCFRESTVSLDVESINDWFIMLVSAFITGLTLKIMPSLHVVMYVCVKALYGFKTSHNPFSHRIDKLLCPNMVSSLSNVKPYNLYIKTLNVLRLLQGVFNHITRCSQPHNKVETK